MNIYDQIANLAARFAYGDRARGSLMRLARHIHYWARKKNKWL